MQRPALEVADIFRDFGPAWLKANRGHVSHAQLKVMDAILACRTAARRFCRALEPGVRPHGHLVLQLPYGE